MQRALEKIEEGTYGLCDVTGELIPMGRLEAGPEAIYILETQSHRERCRNVEIRPEVVFVRAMILDSPATLCG